MNKALALVYGVLGLALVGGVAYGVYKLHGLGSAAIDKAKAAGESATAATGGVAVGVVSAATKAGGPGAGSLVASVLVGLGLMDPATVAAMAAAIGNTPQEKTAGTSDTVSGNYVEPDPNAIDYQAGQLDTDYTGGK